MLAQLSITDDATHACSPAVGIFRSLVTAGSIVTPNTPFGTLTILGRTHTLHTPHASPPLRVSSLLTDNGPSPVGYNDPLLALSPLDLGEGTPLTPAQTAQKALGLPDNAVAMNAPIDGQFYASPSPDAPSFVNVGDTIQNGQRIGLIEVMKFFYDIHFDLEGFPNGAEVVHVSAKNGEAVESGDAILYVVPA